MSVFFPFSMLYTSFLPLWLAVLIIDSVAIHTAGPNLCTEKISFLVILGLLVFCFMILYQGMKVDKKHGNEGSEVYEIKKAKDSKTIVSEYILTFTLPFLAFDFTNHIQVALFLIFFGFLCFLCLKHHHYTVNIVLEMAKYSFYECRLLNADGLEIKANIISKQKLNTKVGSSYYMRDLNNEYMLEVGKTEKN